MHRAHSPQLDHFSFLCGRNKYLIRISSPKENGNEVERKREFENFNNFLKIVVN